MYKPFQAVTSDFSMPVVTVDCMDSPTNGPVMRIHYSKDEVLIITKAQAMEFFGLSDPH